MNGLPAPIRVLISAGPALALGLSGPDPAQAAALPEPVVAAIAVQPIDLETGRPGADLAASSDAVIVNHRGDDGRIAHYYLITVRVSGQPHLDLGGRVNKRFVRQLRITALEGGSKGRVLLATTRNLRAIPDSGSFQIPALIEPGGCKPVTVRASLLGAPKPSSARVTINFTCQN